MQRLSTGIERREMKVGPKKSLQMSSGIHEIGWIVINDHPKGKIHFVYLHRRTKRNMGQYRGIGLVLSNFRDNSWWFICLCLGFVFVLFFFSVSVRVCNSENGEGHGLLPILKTNCDNNKLGLWMTLYLYLRLYLHRAVSGGRLWLIANSQEKIVTIIESVCTCLYICICICVCTCIWQ